ncbi:hypothetical protein BH20GEM2_BH20GEM2_17180 [soil metagenome]|jgi:hypothetical protein
MEGDREPCIELLHPLQVEAFRAMGPERRLAVARAASRMVRSVLAGNFAASHPEWSVREVDAAVAARIGGRTG